MCIPVGIQFFTFSYTCGHEEEFFPTYLKILKMLNFDGVDDDGVNGVRGC